MKGVLTMGKYFGTDGIRGVAGKLLDTTLAHNVGLGLSKAFEEKSVVIGKDTRESGDMLAMALASGAMRSGMDVLYAGTVSTPMIAHYAKKKHMIGIMITASHNPYADNGIKVIDKGYKMSEESELIIESFIDEPKAPAVDHFGRFTVTGDVLDEYKALFDSLGFPKMNLNVCYDSANGSTYEVANDILVPLVDNTEQVHASPDGTNINESCGSMHIEAIQEAVSEKGCDIGFSFDGDGDRVLAVDHTGKLYDGDMLLYVLATHMKEEGTLSKDTVVLTKMSNPGIVKAFNDAGIKVVRTDVGDRNVSLEMQKHGYALGGENSGHIIMRDTLQTGDGVLVAAKVMEVLNKKRRSIDTVCENVEIYPQTMENIHDIDTSLADTKKTQKAVKDTLKRLGKDSLVLIRKSGTEPVIRVTVSHRDRETVDRTIDSLKAIILEQKERDKDE
jgi:phosphoglucosamine mutase